MATASAPYPMATAKGHEAKNAIFGVQGQKKLCLFCVAFASHVEAPPLV